MLNHFFQKAALIACATAIPVSTLGVASAKAFSLPDSAPQHVCESVKYGIKICADRQGDGYNVYTTFGPVTSQKQYLGLDGASMTFGTIDVAGTHAQIQGGLKINPLRIEGKADAAIKVGKLKKHSSKEFTLQLY